MIQVHPKGKEKEPNCYCCCFNLVKMEKRLDLGFLSCDWTARALVAEETILSDFLHSQHCSVIVYVGLHIYLITSLLKPHWNFRKADWNGYMETRKNGSLTVCECSQLRHLHQLP